MENKKNKRKSLITTVAVHAAVLILFALYGLTYPVPRPEQGMLINFGDSDAGSGQVQPDQPTQVDNNSPEPVTETTPTEVTPTEVVEEQIVIAEESPIEIENTTEEKPVEETKPIEETKPVEEEKPRELNENLKKTLKNAFTNNGGSSEGDDENEIGDKGKLDGSKSSTNYSGGGGSGNGFSYDLGGREATFVPKIIDDSQDEGKVVVDIKVDKYGKVISAIPGGRGSTTSSSHLFRKAKEAALKTEFTPNASGPAVQRGQITFVFILE